MNSGCPSDKNNAEEITLSKYQIGLLKIMRKSIKKEIPQLEIDLIFPKN
jgi:hypothetical protein